MAGHQKDPLRPLTSEERLQLEHLSRSRTDPPTQVARAKELLAVAEGASYEAAARSAGRKSGDAVAHLVTRFNQEGIDALVERHGGGQPTQDTAAEQERILREVRSTLDRDQDSTPSRRLEAFSDAVFAIAITLLALNLQVPQLTPVTPQALVAHLAAKWPTYLSFLLSFLTLLIAWVYHHRLLEGAKRAGTGLLFTNGILLLVVAAVPFPTALLGAYLTTPAASVVSAIYAGYIGVLNFTYNLLWWMVVRPPRRKRPKGWRLPTSMILSYLGFPCYLVAVGIAFWSPVATLVICGTLWAVWTIMAPMLSAEQ